MNSAGISSSIEFPVSFKEKSSPLSLNTYALIVKTIHLAVALLIFCLYREWSFHVKQSNILTRWEFLKARGWASHSFVYLHLPALSFIHNDAQWTIHYYEWCIIVLKYCYDCYYDSYSYLMKIQSKLKEHMMVSFPCVCVKSRKVYLDSSPKALV